MDIWTILIIAISFGIVAGIVKIFFISGQKKDFLKLLEALDNFEVTDSLLGEDGVNAFAYDYERKKICLLAISAYQPTAWLFDYKDVLSCEIFEDGESVTKTSRMSQIGGALMGGIAFGGLGAIVGGLSGKTRTANNINRIDLRLIINDSKNPIFDINILDGETTKTGITYKSSMDKARRWHGIVTVIIKRADLADEKVFQVEPNDDKNPVGITELVTAISSSNLIDDLSKLGDLLDRGVLTAEEFQLQKKKLLST